MCRAVFFSRFYKKEPRESLSQQKQEAIITSQENRDAHLSYVIKTDTQGLFLFDRSFTLTASCLSPRSHLLGTLLTWRPSTISIASLRAWRRYTSVCFTFAVFICSAVCIFLFSRCWYSRHYLRFLGDEALIFFSCLSIAFVGFLGFAHVLLFFAAFALILSHNHLLDLEPSFLVNILAGIISFYVIKVSFWLVSWINL